jgi:hypothetical protein
MKNAFINFLYSLLTNEENGELGNIRSYDGVTSPLIDSECHKTKECNFSVTTNLSTVSNRTGDFINLKVSARTLIYILL